MSHSLERICQVPRRFLAILTLLLLIAIPASAGRRIVPSTDRVPLGDWSYDAMISLASDGLVPGYAARLFEGDRLFNRHEMAQIVSLIVESSVDKALTSSQAVLIDHLVSEFKPELLYFEPGAIEKWSGRIADIALPSSREAFPLGYVQGKFTDSAADDTEFVLPYHVSGFARLAPRVFAVATFSDKEEKFFQQTRPVPSPSKLFVRGTDSGYFWSVGRESLDWGPAYSSSVILSDNSPAFTQIRGSREIEFGKIFGRVKVTEFAATFRHEGPRAYLFGRRYEKPFHHNWHLGISETAKTNFAPNPLIAVLPFYLYQAMFIKNDARINTLYSTDLTYLADNGTQTYAELVVDDMTAPRFLRPHNSFSRPRKAGLVAGFYTPKLFHDDRLSTFRAEYIVIDGLTYSATRVEVPELAYTHDGQIIGHPIGPNAKAIYLRGERYFSDKFSAIAEYFNQWQTASGDPERGHRRVVSLTAAYDIRPDMSVAIRIAPFNTALPGVPSESGTKYGLSASFGF